MRWSDGHERANRDAERHLWLERRRERRCIHRVESLLDRDFVHDFRLEEASDIDDGFRELLREAYAVGSQEVPAPPCGR